MGSLQRDCRHLDVIAGHPLTTPEIAKRLCRSTYRQHVWDACRKYLQRVGYVRAKGKPVLWDLKAHVRLR